MAIAGVMMVLAWVPGIDVDKFEPLGFVFDGKGQLSAWGLFAAVLAYYAVRFAVDCWTDIVPWYAIHRGNITQAIKGTASDGPKRRCAAHALRLHRRMWWLDIGVPAAMAVLGEAAASIEIYNLILETAD